MIIEVGAWAMCWIVTGCLAIGMVMGFVLGRLWEDSK